MSRELTKCAGQIAVFLRETFKPFIYEKLKPYISRSLGKDQTMLSVGQYLGLSLMFDLISLI